MTDTKQINVRLPVELHSALAAHKKKTGEDKSEVIRRGIESALGLTGPQPVAEKPVAPPEPKEPKPETVELAAWLSGRLGMPRVLMRRRISEKRVTVNGEVFTDDRLEKTRLLDVAVDGEKIKPPKPQK
jgi:hypothetical protein